MAGPDFGGVRFQPPSHTTMAATAQINPAVSGHAAQARRRSERTDGAGARASSTRGSNCAT